MIHATAWGARRSFGKSALIRLAVVAMLALGLPAAGQARLNPLADISCWRVYEVASGDAAGLPTGEFTAPLSASYNLAYAAPVLAFNYSSGDDYFTGMGAVRNGQFKVLDKVGPLEHATWVETGPYHAAAMLPQGELVVWLAAPREYPRRLSWAVPYGAYCCVVYPPASFEPSGQHWPYWRVLVAYQDKDINSCPLAKLELYDGNGRLLNTATPIELTYSLDAIRYVDFPAGGTSLPYALFATGSGIYSAWYEARTGAWQGDQLAGQAVADPLLYLAPAPDVFGMLLYTDEQDVEAARTLQLLDLNSDGSWVATRWGPSYQLDAEPALMASAFIPTIRLAYPLVAYSDNGDIDLTFINQSLAAGTGRELPCETVTVHTADRLSGGQPRYAVTAVAGAAHWQSGDPQVFWIQDGGPVRSGGQLWCAEFKEE